MSSPTTPILLIEEEPTLLKITAFRLELLGYQVIRHETARAAFDWLRDQLPKLIAVGHMADMKPVDFLNRLSNDSRTNALPVIYISACSDLEEVQRVFNAGVDEYLVTPYDPLMLEQKVGSLLLAASNRGDG